MSVVIVVKVSEGLVLAADSAATLSGSIQGPDGETQFQGVIKTYYNARKVLQVGEDFPIGVATWGAATIGMRTIESLVRQWVHDEGWQDQATYRKDHPNKKYEVKECAEGLLRHLSSVYKHEFEGANENIQGLGMVVAGYSQGEFFPEIWRISIPDENKVVDQRPDIDGRPNFGASWFGTTEPIVRLHFGRDDRVLSIVAEKFGTKKEDVQQLLGPLEYPITFAQMPLQDAIDYAHYMISVVVGRYRFVVGPELSGGEIDIAAITQRQLNWISRKTWRLPRGQGNHEHLD